MYAIAIREENVMNSLTVILTESRESAEVAKAIEAVMPGLTIDTDAQTLTGMTVEMLGGYLRTEYLQKWDYEVVDTYQPPTR